MKKTTPKLISTLELAKLLNVSKTYLYYYVKLKLLEPDFIAEGHGGIFLFDKEKTLKRWNFIQEQKEKGVRPYQIKIT